MRTIRGSSPFVNRLLKFELLKLEFHQVIFIKSIYYSVIEKFIVWFENIVKKGFKYCYLAKKWEQ